MLKHRGREDESLSLNEGSRRSDNMGCRKKMDLYLGNGSEQQTVQLICPDGIGSIKATV